MKYYAMILALLVAALPAVSQSGVSAAPDPWKAFTLLEGTWEAKAVGNGGATAMGTYTFRPELKDHILARHSTTSPGCKGPASFDCEHGDLLYIYQEMPGQAFKAIYFDNEGHVIHYDVSTEPTTVTFLSDASQPGPQFKLVYELKGTVMWGKFQMKMPGQSDWKSYLEWSGEKRKEG